MKSLLRLYKDSLLARMNDTLVQNDAPLTKAQPESTLGNWIADAVKSVATINYKNIDACMLNYGSISKEYIAPGPILRKDIYELIPFENKLVLISVSRSLLSMVCDSIGKINGLPVSGLSFVIDSAKATKILIKGQPLKEYLVYTILINEHLLRHKVLFPLLGKLPYGYMGLSLRNALLQYTQMLYEKGLHIHSDLENRISYAE